MNYKSEILAPAGSYEMLVAAVRSGADAVYLGAKEFSARRNAENFDNKALKKAVEFCHIRGVKVYLTLNILIKETELSEAFLLARDAYNTGVDGVIVQDLGLARFLKEQIPDLKLHASTQMSVHSPSALPILKKMGFTRVVAAREMSREQLKSFCAKAFKFGIEVEVFVHGALCMCLSGQCLLSSFLGSRSGNRGLCAGPCRLPFKVKNGTGYDLSLKDLSLLDYLRELSEMGVASFKIEGRMKRPEYVAAATAACRQMLDKGQTDPELKTTLKNVFSRSGFTAGYYENKLGREMFGVRTKDDVLAADKAFPLLHELYRKEYARIPLNIKAEILEGRPILLTLFDGENSVTATGNHPSRAQNRPLNREDVIKSFSKLGDTPYYYNNGNFTIGEGLFVSASELNELRRKAVALLVECRSKVNHALSDAVYLSPKAKAQEKKIPAFVARFEKSSQIPDDLSGISAVMLPIEENPDIKIDENIIKIADIPRGIVSEDLIEKRLKLFARHGFRVAACGNLAAVEIAKNAGFSVLADTGFNITNPESVITAEKMGVTGVVLSTELTINDAKFCCSIPKGIIAYGKIPLMIFKNCPIKNGISCENCDKNGIITDRLGVEFNVRCRMGYSEMLNSVPVWLADRKEELSGLDFLVLYFTTESKQRALEVIEMYKAGAAPDVKHTRGLYYRGMI